MDGTSPRLAATDRVRAALAANGVAEVVFKEFAESTATRPPGGTPSAPKASASLRARPHSSPYVI